MFRCILLFFVFLLFLGCTPSDPSPYFYKVEKDGKESYLLGTVHQGVSLYELPCSHYIVDKLKNSDLVFLEIVSDDNDRNNDEYFLDYFSQNGQDFKSLSRSSQKFLKKKRINPSLSYIGLSTALRFTCLKETLGNSATEISMDSQVEEMAREYEISLKALDNKKLREPINDLYSRDDIEEMIDYYPSCLAETEILNEDYKLGNVDYAITNSDEMSTKSDEILLKNRNEYWLKKFLKAHRSYDQIFLAAGLAHFIDKFNLIDMLNEEGFYVERVSCPPPSLVL